jgi:short-subunit dehydrogenase
LSFFKNKVVWITGASSGIGEAAVIEFAKLGARLVLSARRENELIRVSKMCALTDDNCLILPFDLNEISIFNLLTEEVIKKFGQIDFLLNNGGFSQRSDAVNTPLDLDRKIMEVNYFANIALSKNVLPYMIKQGNGHIIVISSIAGKFGFYLRSSYSAAKHALHGFYESVRLENEKKGIKITIVCPGKIKTNISINALTEDGNKHNKMDESHKDCMSAEQCAKKIISGIIKNKEELLIGGKELNAVWIKRFFPNLFSKIIRKQSPF